MINTKTETIAQKNGNVQNVCNFNYLIDVVGGKKHLIKDMMDTFLLQIPEELKSINDAVLRNEFPAIKSLTHKLKSSVSIMGITAVQPIIEEIHKLAEKGADIDKIIELNKQLNLICKMAMDEVEKEQLNYG